MRVSLIIPVYNERAKIGQCLKNLRGLAGDPEIIFADGGSTDGTPDAIDGAFRVISCPKGRARQMNAAASAASGDILWFSHCDSLLPADACLQIKRAAAGGAVFGCFHIGFDYDGPFMGFNTYMSNRRAKKKRIAFGDQGIFVERELFFRQGGFPDLPIMEDYELSRRMKRQNIPLTVLDGRIITSDRRYQQAFPLRVMLKMVWLRFLYRLGVDIDTIARLYRDVR